MCRYAEALIADSLVEYLRSIPVAEVEAMRQRGAALRCLFAYQAAEGGCNAFSATMWVGLFTPGVGLSSLGVLTNALTCWCFVQCSFIILCNICGEKW